MKYIGKATKLLSGFDLEAMAKQFSDDIIVLDSGTAIPKNVDPKQCIILVENAEADEVIGLTKTSMAHNVIQMKRDDVESELAISAQLITDNSKFLKDPIQFLNIRGNELTIEFRETAKKDSFLKEVSNFVQSIPPLRTMASGTVLIADELFSNALFDAPTDKNGRRKFNDLPRNSKIELDPGEHATLFLSYDDDKLLIAARDPFGSMDECRFLDRLQSCYSGEQITDVNMGVGGAGIGCRMLFDHSISLYVGVKKGACTVTCCVLALGPSEKMIQKIPKNIHISAKK